MDYDFTKDGTDNLIALINAGNNTSFARNHLGFGTPQPNMDTPPPGKEANTKITVAGLASVAFTGSVDIHYNRMELGDVLNTTDFQFNNTMREANSVHDLLPWFLEQGYLFTQSDLENDLLMSLSGENEQVIRAKPESLLFLGLGKIKITS